MRACRISPRLPGLAAAAALAAGMVVAAPMTTTAAPEDVGRVAAPDARRGFDGSIVASVPPGGTATVTSGALDRQTQIAKVLLDAEGDLSTTALIDMTTLLGRAPTKADRLLTCIALTYDPAFVFTQQSEEPPPDLDVEQSTAALVSLVTCLRLAGLVRDQGTSRSSAAAAKPRCDTAPGRIPAKLTKTETGFRLTTSGRAKAAKKSSPLRVTCRAKPGGRVAITVRPKARGKSLRSVVGKTLAIGLASPDPETDATVKVTFAAG